jgi:hypothetical protein
MFVASFACLKAAAISDGSSAFSTSLASKLLFENSAALFTFMGAMFFFSQVVNIVAYVVYTPRSQTRP